MRLRFFMTVVALFSYAIVSSDDSINPLGDPGAFYTMIELVCAEGYHIQEHVTVTEDGYILKIFRIPGGKRRPKVPKRKHHYHHLHYGYHPDFADCVADSLRETPAGPPVLLAHGVIAASDVWVLQGPNSDLAFLLADKGYDVWFSNVRGNYYSRQHKTLKPSSEAFWDFSFHENGIYDMPATIDLILSLTASPKLIYIGHSMGTTMFFVMASEKPEYKDKVQLFVGLTPVAQLIGRHFSSLRKAVLDFVINLMKELESIGVQEFLPRNLIVNLIAKTFCWMGSPFQNLCNDLSFFFTGFHSKLFLRRKLTTYLTHTLGGTSCKTFRHFLRMLDAPSFRQFDYGPEENFRRYGQPEPPEYNLGNVTVPTALFYSRDDYIAYVKDVEVLKTYLPNIIENLELTHYGHLDFVWAYTAKKLLYPKVMEVVDKFRNLTN